ncbi:MAG: hypothetical protein PVJ97_02395 [Flavobacteriaceae bacterium]|jgi:hypothetical protein
MINSVIERVFSEKTKKQSERFIINIAIISFVAHLLVIFANDLGWISVAQDNSLFTNPIAAIYTPFSFILIYEVYLLIYYLPKSMTIYIGKQYEIIMLIVIRRLYKDLSQLELSSDWFSIKEDLQFTYDILGTIILFLLIHLFYKMNKYRVRKLLKMTETRPEIVRFIKVKKVIALVLVPVFILMASLTFGQWIYQTLINPNQLGDLSNINNLFFDEFFTVLILVDVLLLLFSFTHTDKFNKVIRNSGFVISTILVKLSFGAEGLLNSVLIISAVGFGVLILWIHMMFEKNKIPTNY